MLVLLFGRVSQFERNQTGGSINCFLSIGDVVGSGVNCACELAQTGRIIAYPGSRLLAFRRYNADIIGHEQPRSENWVGNAIKQRISYYLGAAWDTSVPWPGFALWTQAEALPSKRAIQKKTVGMLATKRFIFEKN